MKLIFADDSNIEVRNIFSTKTFIGGSNRESFSIEIEHGKYSIDNLILLFSDIERTNDLRTEDNDGTIYNIGKDFTLLTAISYEKRDKTIPLTNGASKPEYNEFVVVRLAQITYVEKMIEQLEISKSEEKQEGVD